MVREIQRINTEFLDDSLQLLKPNLCQFLSSVD
jgi:hypothetical protein